MAETESRLVDELSARDRDLQHLRATVQHSTDDVARANARADEARGALVAVQAELDAALQRAERAKAVAADDARRWEAERSTLLSRHGAAQARCDELERACAELGQQLAVRDAECKVLTQQMEAGHSVAETVIHEYAPCAVAPCGAKQGEAQLSACACAGSGQSEQ